MKRTANDAPGADSRKRLFSDEQLIPDRRSEISTVDQVTQRLRRLLRSSSVAASQMTDRPARRAAFHP